MPREGLEATGTWWQREELVPTCLPQNNDVNCQMDPPSLRSAMLDASGWIRSFR